LQLFLFDSDIIIDYLRGFEGALKFFESFDHDFHTSVVTVAELYSGERDKDHQELEYFMSLFTVFPLTVEIAKEAGFLRQSYFRSHGMGLADAMVAATAKAHGATLLSLNSRHFSMLDNLLIPYTK